jgi:uncharacterized repeat protein (TIGR03803 family)
MKPILFTAIAALFTCGIFLQHSIAGPADRYSLAGPPPTFPCQTCGTVFSFDPSTGSEIVVHSFEDDGVDGYDPNAGLIEYRGDLYGTTESGGSSGKSCGDFCGTVYSIDLKTGREKVLYTFLGGTDALNPGAGLHTVGHVFYGTTFNGGTGSAGTVFSFDPKTRMEAVVYSFQQNGQDGVGPSSSLIDVGGILYGVTGGGGTYGGGTLFSVNPANGAETVLHSFGNGQDGDNPYTNLTAVGQVLYGTTYSGGTHGPGTVFSLNLSTGVETVVHSFTDGDDGAGPYGGLVRASGRLYGTTVDDDTCSDGDTGQGSVYAIDIANGAEINLHCFSDYTQGGGLEPFGSLIRDKLFYGTTQVGGSGTSCGSGDCGTIFSMTKYGHTKTLYSFCSQAGCPDGAYPQGDLIDVGGVFYGTTVDGGSGAGAPAGQRNGSAPR